MRRRRHRHRRSWARRAQKSFLGFGVLFVLALVVAAALVFAALPAFDSTFAMFLAFPDMFSDLQRKATSR